MINSSSWEKAAWSMQLRYVHPSSEGYIRVKKGKCFKYSDAEGKIIEDAAILDRIKKLVLPPAWKKVWISPYPDSHLQATGVDTKGRKQYRYHNDWSAIRNSNKFENIFSFGKKLPLLRKKIRHDIHTKSFEKEKVCAIALSIMDETYIRAGNDVYEKENGSFGLTTLKNRHVKIEGSKAFFKFRGKKGIIQMQTLKTASLVKLLKQIKELPGQELFQYYNEDGKLTKLESGDVNHYIKETMGCAFSCKDFRTWAGSVIALQLMAAKCKLKETDEAPNTIAVKKKPVDIIDGVAARLGNTRSVCRKYYIHPALLRSFELNETDRDIKKLNSLPSGKLHSEAEKVLLSFLRKHTQN